MKPKTKTPEQVIAQPKVQELLMTAGIDITKMNAVTKNFFMRNIKNWIKQGHNLPKMKANLCGLLVRGLENESARTNNKNVKFMNKTSINILKDLQGKFNRQSTLKISGRIETPEQREMDRELKKALAKLNAPEPKSRAIPHGRVFVGKAAIAAARKAKLAETPIKIAKKGPLIAFTKTESEILGKIGIPRAGAPRKEFLRSFYIDVAKVASDKQITAYEIEEPTAKYAGAVNKYGKQIAAQLRQGQTITASKVKSIMPSVLRNEARTLATAKTKRATRARRPAPAVAHTYQLQTVYGKLKVTSNKPLTAIPFTMMQPLTSPARAQQIMRDAGITSISAAGRNITARTLLSRLGSPVADPITLTALNRAAKLAEKKRRM
jgi:hypothetical protein